MPRRTPTSMPSGDTDFDHKDLAVRVAYQNSIRQHLASESKYDVSTNIDIRCFGLGQLPPRYKFEKKEIFYSLKDFLVSIDINFDDPIGADETRNPPYKPLDDTTRTTFLKKVASVFAVAHGDLSLDEAKRILPARLQDHSEAVGFNECAAKVRDGAKEVASKLKCSHGISVLLHILTLPEFVEAKVGDASQAQHRFGTTAQRRQFFYDVVKARPMLAIYFLEILAPALHYQFIWGKASDTWHKKLRTDMQHWLIMRVAILLDWNFQAMYNSASGRLSDERIKKYKPWNIKQLGADSALQGELSFWEWPVSRYISTYARKREWSDWYFDLVRNRDVNIVGTQKD